MGQGGDAGGFGRVCEAWVIGQSDGSELELEVEMGKSRGRRQDLYMKFLVPGVGSWTVKI